MDINEEDKKKKREGEEVHEDTLAPDLDDMSDGDEEDEEDTNEKEDEMVS